MKLTAIRPAAPSATPAQENSASKRPSNLATAASTLAWLRRSMRTDWAAGWSMAATSSAVTCAPNSAASRAAAAPMPVAAPKTNARLPSYRNCSSPMIGPLDSERESKH